MGHGRDHEINPRDEMLAPALLTGPAVPIVTIRAVLWCARGDGLLCVGTEELITVTRLAEVHGLWVGNGPDTISIVAIDSSKLLGDNIVTTSVLCTFSFEVTHSGRRIMQRGRRGLAG